MKPGRARPARARRRHRRRGRRVSGEERFLVGEGRIRDVERRRTAPLLLLIDADDGALLRVTPAAHR